MAMEKRPDRRLTNLDGLRGWAALLVLISHLIYGLFIGLIPLARMPVLDVFLDGHLMVFVFFVLSGFALTTKFIEAPGKFSVAQAVAARYFRLAPPIFVSSAVAYLLLKSHLNYNVEAASLTQDAPWLGSFYRFDPSLVGLIKFSLYKVFFNYDSATTYNSNLWTMAVEFQGSMLVYAIVAVCVTSARRRFSTLAIGAAAAIFLLKAPDLACFIFGYVLAESYHSPIAGNSIVKAMAAATLPIVLWIKTAFPYDETSDACNTLLAAGIVFAVVFAPPYGRAFSSKFSGFLGKISFPLYLLQMPIICSYSSVMLLQLSARGASVSTCAAVITVSSVILALAASWMLLPVERFSIHFSNRAGQLLVRLFSIPRDVTVNYAGTADRRASTKEQIIA